MDAGFIFEFLREYPAYHVTMTFVVGAVVASFAGLASSRLPRQIGWYDEKEEDISLWWPPSHCDSCKSPIAAWALIPVLGWVLARGRCRECKRQVPIKYPLVEAACGTVSALLAYFFGPDPQGIALLALFWFAVLVSWCDIEHHLIPEVFTIPMLWLGFLFSPFELDAYSRIVGAFLGFAIVWFAFALVGKMKGVNTMSGGDIMLAIVIGAWCGHEGLIVSIFLASLFYIAYSIPYRLSGVQWSPMGPALALGGIATLSLGLDISMLSIV